MLVSLEEPEPGRIDMTTFTTAAQIKTTAKRTAVCDWCGTSAKLKADGKVGFHYCNGVPWRVEQGDTRSFRVTGTPVRKES
jgi:hypothetical protein